MAGSITLWYRRQFNLPPNDPRFLELTPLEILTEYHAHRYDDLYSQGKLDILVEDHDFDLDEVLGEMESDDQWEDLINES